MSTHILLRRDTAANWTANNPVLGDGEQGLEKDTGKVKIGNGATAWAQLPYWTPGNGTFASLQALRISTRRHGSVLPFPPVGTRTAWPNALSNGTDTGQNTFLQHFLPTGVVEVRFAFANVTGVGEAAGNNAVPVRVGCGLPDGTVLPVYFKGSRAGSVDPGGLLISDPVAVPPSVAYVVSRTNVAVTAGQKWPISFPDNLSRSVEGAEKGTSITDKSLTGTITSGGGTGVAMYGPVAVIGRPSGGDWSLMPAVGAVGDSILYGQGDGLVAAGGRGFFERAVNNAYGYVTTGIPTETLAQFNTESAHSNRLGLMQGCTAILAQHGVNDARGGASFATMQALYATYWGLLAATGAQVFQTTITPVSTSTDDWTSVANQTTDATNTVRAAVNDWMRDGAPYVSGSPAATGTSGAARCAVYSKSGALVTAASGPAHPVLTGVFDAADAVESSRNSGKWAIDPAQRTVTDAGMTSGSDILTSATANFVTGDVTTNRARVTGAGGSGGVLLSTIRARTGATTVNLSNTASTTVSGTTAVVGSSPTVDGIHPSGYAPQAMAAAIPVSVLASLPSK